MYGTPASVTLGTANIGVESWDEGDMIVPLLAVFALGTITERGAGVLGPAWVSELNHEDRVSVTGTETRLLLLAPSADPW